MNIDNEKKIDRTYENNRIESEVEPYNTLDIEAVLDKAFGNLNKKTVDGEDIKDGN
jgi:hypothetical protein